MELDILDNAILITGNFALFYENSDELGCKVLKVCEIDDFIQRTVFIDLAGELHEKTTTIRDKIRRNEAEDIAKRHWSNIRGGIYG